MRPRRCPASAACGSRVASERSARNGRKLSAAFLVRPTPICAQRASSGAPPGTGKTAHLEADDTWSEFLEDPLKKRSPTPWGLPRWQRCPNAGQVRSQFVHCLGWRHSVSSLAHEQKQRAGERECQEEGGDYIQPPVPHAEAPGSDDHPHQDRSGSD